MIYENKLIDSILFELIVYLYYFINSKISLYLYYLSKLKLDKLNYKLKFLKLL